MSDLVENPEDRFSQNEAHFNGALLTAYLYVAMYHCYHTKKERTDPGLLLGPSGLATLPEAREMTKEVT